MQDIAEVQVSATIHGQTHHDTAVGHLFGDKIEFIGPDVLVLAIEGEAQSGILAVKQDKRLMVLTVVLLQLGRLHPSAFGVQFQFDQIVLQGDYGFLSLAGIEKKRGGIFRSGLLHRQLLLCCLLGLMLLHKCLDGILVVLHLCLFLTAGAVEKAEANQHGTNQDEPDKRVFFHSW